MIVVFLYGTRVCMYVHTPIFEKYFFLDTTVCSFPFVNQVLYTMLHVVSYTLAMSRLFYHALCYVMFLDFLYMKSCSAFCMCS
jgi:hypothetical protein